MTKLTKDFYSSPATELAPKLLGKILCRTLPDGTVLRARITETECYYGEEDTACHASKGRTARTSVMYKAGGCAYIYLCYGIHYLLNVVTGGEGHPEAVLIRGIEGAEGPGRLTRSLQIDKELNGEDLTKSARLWIEQDCTPPPKYTATKRIGIDYAAPADRERLWRFKL